MVSTLDFESSDPSSNLGGTSLTFSFFFLFFFFFFGGGGGEPSYYIHRPVRTYNFFPSQSVINILTDNDQEYRCIRANRLIIGEHNRIAQLVEHCTGNAKVVGSNPVQSLNFFFRSFFQ